MILLCARAELRDGDGARICELIADGLNWDAMLGGALRQALIPFVHLHLNGSAMSQLPPEAAARLHSLAQRMAAPNAYHVGELRGLLADLSVRGVAAIPYKGSALALKVYGSPYKVTPATQPLPSGRPFRHCKRANSSANLLSHTCVAPRFSESRRADPLLRVGPP